MEQYDPFIDKGNNIDQNLSHFNKSHNFPIYPLSYLIVFHVALTFDINANEEEIQILSEQAVIIICSNSEAFLSC